jgi:hypothetical protein
MLEGSDTHGRRHAVVHCASLADWQPTAEDFPGGYALLVAIDAAQWSIDDGLAFARRCIETGCASVSIWGTECEVLHDLFDEEDACSALYDQTAAVLMTAWHADDLLESAIDFFIEHDIVADDWPSRPKLCVGLAIGASHLASRIEDLLRLRLAHRQPQ